MLIIMLFNSFSEMLCMVGLANSGWQKVKESPYTPYALSPVAGAAGWAAAKLTCDAGFGILNKFDRQLHPGIYFPLALGITGTAMVTGTLPSLILTAVIGAQRNLYIINAMKQRQGEPYLLYDNLSSWQFYYPAIIQGLTLGLPFAYYLAHKENRFPSIVEATLLSCAAATPGLLAAIYFIAKENEKKRELKKWNFDVNIEEEKEQRQQKEEREREERKQRDELIKQALRLQEEERLNRERLQREREKQQREIDRNNNMLTQNKQAEPEKEEKDDEDDEPMFRTEDLDNN